jgi:hypothetical protein
MIHGLGKHEYLARRAEFPEKLQGLLNPGFRYIV